MVAFVKICAVNQPKKIFDNAFTAFVVKLFKYISNSNFFGSFEKLSFENHFKIFFNFDPEWWLMILIKLNVVKSMKNF